MLDIKQGYAPYLIQYRETSIQHQTHKGFTRCNKNILPQKVQNLQIRN